MIRHYKGGGRAIVGAIHLTGPGKKRVQKVLPKGFHGVDIGVGGGGGYITGAGTHGTGQKSTGSCLGHQG